MSLTPIDEGQGTHPDIVHRESGPPSRRERITAGLRSLVEALPLVHRLLEDSSESSDTDPSSDDRSTSADVIRNSSDCSAFETLPARAHPVTSPPQTTAGDPNPIELVGEEHGETLTIMFPDCPETSITSDMFVEVEP